MVVLISAGFRGQRGNAGIGEASTRRRLGGEVEEEGIDVAAVVAFGVATLGLVCGFELGEWMEERSTTLRFGGERGYLVHFLLSYF